MIIEIVAILVGLVLLTGLLGVVPTRGDSLKKFTKWLRSFQTIVGLMTLLAGILDLL